MLKSVVLYLLLAGTVVAASRTDQATGLLFPDSISRWGFSNMQEYEPKALGISYSYKSKLQRQGAITCYIYNKGAEKIPFGAASPEVRKEIEEVRWAVGEAWRRRGAQVEDLVGVHEIKTNDGTIVALLCAHRITIDGVANISLTAISAWKDHFLKVRFTFPGENLNQTIYDLGGFLEFVTEIRSINEKVIDPLFLAPVQQSELIARP